MRRLLRKSSEGAKEPVLTECKKEIEHSADSAAIERPASNVRCMDAHGRKEETNGRNKNCADVVQAEKPFEATG